MMPIRPPGHVGPAPRDGRRPAPARAQGEMHSAAKGYRYGTAVGTFDGGRDGVRLDPNGYAPQSHALMPACSMQRTAKSSRRASNPSKRGLNRYEMIIPSDDAC